jgi:hypothetical protein
MPGGKREESISLDDLRQWAEQELKDTAKAAELRAKQTKELVSDYSEGRLSPKQATDRYRQYRERWGEALPGATMNEGLSDDAILAQIDEVRRSLRSVRKSYRESDRSR